MSLTLHLKRVNRKQREVLAVTKEFHKAESAYKNAFDKLMLAELNKHDDFSITWVVSIVEKYAGERRITSEPETLDLNGILKNIWLSAKSLPIHSIDYDAGVLTVMFGQYSSIEVHFYS